MVTLFGMLATRTAFRPHCKAPLRPLLRGWQALFAAKLRNWGYCQHWWLTGVGLHGRLGSPARMPMAGWRTGAGLGVGAQGPGPHHRRQATISLSHNQRYRWVNQERIISTLELKARRGTHGEGGVAFTGQGPRRARARVRVR